MYVKEKIIKYIITVSMWNYAENKSNFGKFMCSYRYVKASNSNSKKMISAYIEFQSKL